MIHSQLSNSKVQVCESSGKRLKSMLQAAVTVTLGTRTMHNTDENTETLRLRSLYFIIFLIDACFIHVSNSKSIEFSYAVSNQIGNCIVGLPKKFCHHFLSFMSKLL